MLRVSSSRSAAVITGAYPDELQMGKENRADSGRFARHLSKNLDTLDVPQIRQLVRGFTDLAANCRRLRLPRPRLTVKSHSIHAETRTGKSSDEAA